jgi:hypothetical protein
LLAFFLCKRSPSQKKKECIASAILRGSAGNWKLALYGAAVEFMEKKTNFAPCQEELKDAPRHTGTGTQG